MTGQLNLSYNQKNKWLNESVGTLQQQPQQQLIKSKHSPGIFSYHITLGNGDKVKMSKICEFVDNSKSSYVDHLTMELVIRPFKEKMYCFQLVLKVFEFSVNVPLNSAVSFSRDQKI